MKHKIKKKDPWSKIHAVKWAEFAGYGWLNSDLLSQNDILNECSTGSGPFISKILL